MNKLILIVTIFAVSKLTFAKVLIPWERANYTSFQKYLEASEYINYSQFLLEEMSKKTVKTSDIFEYAEKWLSEESSYLETNSYLRKIQIEGSINNSVRKLLFDIFQKKLTQDLESSDRKYYVSQLCWLFTNDKSLQYEFNQFQQYCHFKKISLSELSHLYPNYNTLISDGNIFELKNGGSLRYNQVPQKIILLSDKKNPLYFYGNAEELKNKPKPEENFLVQGNCEDYKTESNFLNQDFDIYFDNDCVRPFKPIPLISRMGTFLSDNKYEFLAGIVLMAFAYDYLKDKNLKFDSSSNPFHLNHGF